MEKSSKLETYKRHMAERGIGNATAFPPLWQFLWWRGVCIPPPPFMGFLTLVALAGSAFGTFFAAGSWVIELRHGTLMSFEKTLWIAFGTGLAFGVIMAAYYRHMGRKHRLGSWAQFSAPQLRT